MHARMMRLKMTAESLRSLARSVACWHYVTPVDNFSCWLFGKSRMLCRNPEVLHPQCREVLSYALGAYFRRSDFGSRAQGKK